MVLLSIVVSYLLYLKPTLQLNSRMSRSGDRRSGSSQVQRGLGGVGRLVVIYFCILFVVASYQFQM